jgi:hypothetical protein
MIGGTETAEHERCEPAASARVTAIGALIRIIQVLPTPLHVYCEAIDARSGLVSFVP